MPMNSATTTSEGLRKPKYQRLKAILSEQIRQGRYKVGDRLPSENELSEELGISRHTVLKGLAELAAEGWIDRHMKTQGQ